MIVVTRHLAKAARACDPMEFLYLGNLGESGTTYPVFPHRVERLSENYVTGRFG